MTRRSTGQPSTEQPTCLLTPIPHQPPHQSGDNRTASSVVEQPAAVFHSFPPSKKKRGSGASGSGRSRVQLTSGPSFFWSVFFLSSSVCPLSLLSCYRGSWTRTRAGPKWSGILDTTGVNNTEFYVMHHRGGNRGGALPRYLPANIRHQQLPAARMTTTTTTTTTEVGRRQGNNIA